MSRQIPDYPDDIGRLPHCKNAERVRGSYSIFFVLVKLRLAALVFQAGDQRTRLWQIQTGEEIAKM